MPPVEQIKLKRAGTGLRACDRDRAFPGFTLFAPQSGSGKVYLIDLEGNVTHTWQMPYSPGNSGYLTERGTLFYNGKIIEDSRRFISERPWKGGAALEVDWKCDDKRVPGSPSLFIKQARPYPRPEYEVSGGCSPER